MPKLKFFPHCTEYNPQYWCYLPLYWCYPPTCTDVIPPMYWIPSTVLKLSPTLLMLFHHCTEQPPQYWGIPHSTEAIPHMYCCYPPQYWRYPSTVLMLFPHMYWCYPPLYWTISTVLKLSPTVLNNLHSTEAIPHSTEAIPHSTDVIPPMYWTTSNVLNNLQCTEQPPMYWTTSTVLNRRHMGWICIDVCTLYLINEL